MRKNLAKVIVDYKLLVHFRSDSTSGYNFNVFVRTIF